MPYPEDPSSTFERLASRNIDRHAPEPHLLQGHTGQWVDQCEPKALKAGFRAIDQFAGDSTKWRIPATCKGMLEGYDAQWQDAQQSIKLIDVETVMQSDLMNLETERTSRTFRLAGKRDKLAKQNGTVLFDHKTTSMDIADPSGPYWMQLQLEGQPSQYEILMLANGVRIDRAVWDVARKPGIRPKKISLANRKTITSLGKYCDRDVSGHTQAIMVNEERENAELFQIRVACETKENPTRYFARRSVPRTRAELAEYNQQVWMIAEDIRRAQKEDRHHKNAGACMNYGSACEFLGICSGHDSPDSDRWVRKEHVHNELDDSVGDGRKFLTNSRVRCFQTCPQKHYLKYELGIERPDEEERESLYFGNVWHAAMDAWWVSISQERESINGN